MNKNVLIIASAAILIAGGGLFAKKQMDAAHQQKAEKALEKAASELKANVESEYNHTLGPDDATTYYKIAYRSHTVQAAKLLASQEEARRLGHRDTTDLEFQTSEIQKMLEKEHKDWAEAEEETAADH